MKRRFTDEQIIMMIKEQEIGLSTKVVCRKHGINEARFYKYKLDLSRICSALMLKHHPHSTLAHFR